MRHEVMAVLGNGLRKARRQRNLSTVELAQVVNLSSRELEEVECARMAIRTDQLVGLSNALNVPMLSLFWAEKMPVKKAHS